MFQVLTKFLLAVGISIFIVAGSEAVRIYIAPKGVWSSDPAMLITIPALLLICDFLFSFLGRCDWIGNPPPFILKIFIYSVLGFVVFQLLNYAFSCYIVYWASNGERFCMPLGTTFTGSLKIDGIALYINGVATEAGKLSEILDRTKQFVLHAFAGLLWELTLPRILLLLFRAGSNS